MGQFSFYKPGTDPLFTLFLGLLGEIDLLRIEVGYDIGFGYANLTCAQRCGELRIDNLVLNARSVPEPASLSLLGIGLLGAIAAGRRKQRA